MRFYYQVDLDLALDVVSSLAATESQLSEVVVDLRWRIAHLHAIWSGTARIQSLTATTGPGVPSRALVTYGTRASDSGCSRLCWSHSTASRRSSVHEVADQTSASTSQSCSSMLWASSAHGTATPEASTPSEHTSSAPAEVQINEDDYLGRPVDEVAAELRDKGLEVDTQPVDNPGDKDADTVANVRPTAGLVKGDTVTVEYYREPEPTSEPPTTEPTTEPTSEPPSQTPSTTPPATATSTASQAQGTASAAASASPRCESGALPCAVSATFEPAGMSCMGQE